MSNPAKAVEALSVLPEEIREDVAMIIEQYGHLEHKTLLRPCTKNTPPTPKRADCTNESKAS
jgi:hypothetical protein